MNTSERPDPAHGSRGTFTASSRLVPIALALAIASLACSRQPPPDTDADVAGSALNTSYSLEHLGAGTIQLDEGAYEDSAAGLAARVVATATGDLDRDRRPDAAVVLATETGGTGTFMDLYAVLARDGRVVSRGPASLGDRVKVDSITVHEGTIAAYLVTHGPEDALCCPTQRVVQHYVLQADTLVQRPQELP